MLIWVVMSGVLTCHDERGPPPVEFLCPFLSQKHLHFITLLLDSLNVCAFATGCVAT